MLYQVDQAEAMVNIINKKYVTGNRMAYLSLLSGAGSWLERNSKFAYENYGINWGKLGKEAFC